MKNYLLISLVFWAAACSKSSDLHVGIERPGSTSASADKVTIEDPKVDILFVVDNSQSMDSFQDKMKKNVELFANEFFSNLRIDFRIGVVPVYDSVYLNDKTVYTPSGLRKMNALGELIRPKGVAAEAPPFITRDTPNALEVLKETVKIGTQWGPEAEESFSPVLAITDSQINTTKNGGFYRPEAYLAVIFLTDADDVTPGLSAGKFLEELVKLKKGIASQILIAAALMDPSKPSAECKKSSERGAVQRFPELLNLSAGTRADLCSEDFGTPLAQFGKQLAQRVAEQRVHLNDTPDFNTLRVIYGTKEEFDNDKGDELSRAKGQYIYLEDSQEIVIPSSAELPPPRPGAKIWVKAKKASIKNLKDGKTQIL